MFVAQSTEKWPLFISAKCIQLNNFSVIFMNKSCHNFKFYASNKKNQILTIDIRGGGSFISKDIYLVNYPFRGGKQGIVEKKTA